MPREAEDTPFKRWIFTPEEQLQASVFSDLQSKWIQTFMTDAAEEKVSLQTDPLNPLLHLLQEGYCRGQIDMCKFFLGLSADRKSELQRIMEEKHRAAQGNE